MKKMRVIAQEKTKYDLQQEELNMIIHGFLHSGRHIGTGIEVTSSPTMVDRDTIEAEFQMGFQPGTMSIKNYTITIRAKE